MKDPFDNSTQELLEEPPQKKRGRPAKHANAAEKQKAYRARKKEEGLREVKRYVRDVRDDTPLRSDIIDLSEVRGGGSRDR